MYLHLFLICFLSYGHFDDSIPLLLKEFLYMLSLFQEGINRRQQLSFLHHTARSPKYFALSEQHQCRYGLYAVLTCSHSILVHIHLDDAYSITQHAFYLFQDWMHHLAWLAPCGKEIDQDELATIDYIVECFHFYLSISVNRLNVFPSLVTFSKNIFSGLTQ